MGAPCTGNINKEEGYRPVAHVEDEEGFQDILGHRPEVALGKDGEFVGGYHCLGSGIEVIVALEGLQAYIITKG